MQGCVFCLSQRLAASNVVCTVCAGVTTRQRSPVRHDALRHKFTALCTAAVLHNMVQLPVEHNGGILSLHDANWFLRFGCTARIFSRQVFIILDIPIPLRLITLHTGQAALYKC